MLSPFVGERAQRYRLAEELGEGTYGSVRVAWDTQLACSRALKTFKPEDDGDVSECALREIGFQAFLTDVHAPGIVPLLEVFSGSGAEISMLMPLMEDDLAEGIDEEEFGSWSTARPVLKDILEALSYLHACRPPIMHRDLKPENVLRDPTGKAYLTDFGFMRFTKDGPPYETGPASQGSNQRSTRTYSAPEMLRHGTPHGPPVDIWATGVIAVELLQNARLTAQTDRTARRQLRKCCAGTQGEPHSSVLFQLLDEDPTKRCSAATALASPPFKTQGLSAPPPDAPPLPRLVHEDPEVGSEVAGLVADWMRQLDFKSPQTFYAACAYAADALSWRGLPLPPTELVCLHACQAASKLYEHEYWSIEELEEKLEQKLTSDSVLFQKLLVQNRGGRLLVPFPEKGSLAAALLPVPKAARRRRLRKKTAEPAVADGAENVGGGGAPREEVPTAQGDGDGNPPARSSVDTEEDQDCDGDNTTDLDAQDAACPVFHG